MELFGLVLSIPFTLIVSAVFCYVAWKSMNRFGWIRRITPIIFAAILLSVFAEIVGLSALGPWRVHERFGLAFDFLHSVNFFTAAPTIACMLLGLAPPNTPASRSTLGVAILACWIVCVVSVFSNVIIDEAINGVDVSGIVPGHPASTRE